MTMKKVHFIRMLLRLKFLFECKRSLTINISRKNRSLRGRRKHILYSHKEGHEECRETERAHTRVNKERDIP